eukprot:m.308265 g.308265  ORF g.308265 m.308265 type:complete len:699 (+) comp43651_c0_seq1:3181-5277(+)
MFGFINKALENLIVRKYGGKEVWKTIRAQAALLPTENQELQERQIYDDAYTFRLVAKASEICGVTSLELLEGFGEQFFIWCREYGYDRTLQALGATVRDFLTNLDALHDHLATNMFPGMRAPSFRCSDGPDGELYLHYYSVRRGLEPIVIGIVKTVARELHNTKVEMKVIQPFTKDHDHVIFSIREIELEEVVTSSTDRSAVVRQRSFKPDLSYLDRFTWLPVPPNQFCVIFPFHIIFDANYYIRQLGVSLYRVITSSGLSFEELRMNDIFDVERPQGMSLDFNEIISHINMVFILISRNANKSEALRLKGQMIYLSHPSPSGDGQMLFLCSPRVSDLVELKGRQLYLSDLPLHDATRDLMLLDDTRASQHIQIVKLEEVNTQLNEAHSELADAHGDLAKEKDLTDKLLYSMFPFQVATQLKKNKPVPAETFASVTILFSDIVGFTTICGQCPPADIVGMLDVLYKEFDAITKENGLYKVETIGDAYMVVGGLTNPLDKHEEMVCNQALDMMAVVQRVRDPTSKSDHIHIRVGVHSGEVMAGVVGHLMPRYCLFGDTVNVASRTESTGMADKIHVTEATQRRLAVKKPNFIFVNQHEVKMKNVPHPMVCYFLQENTLRIRRRNELVQRKRSVYERPSCSYDDDDGDDRLLSPEGDEYEAASAGIMVHGQQMSEVAGKVLLVGALGSLVAAVFFGLRSS